MRKRSHRKVRNASPLISPQDHEKLVMAPNMSLAMLLMGKGSEQDVHNVIGILNLGSALACLSNNQGFEHLIHLAQDVCSTIIEAESSENADGSYAVPDDLRLALIEGFQRVDRIIALTSRQRLLEAAKNVHAVLAQKLALKEDSVTPSEVNGNL